MLDYGVRTRGTRQRVSRARSCSGPRSCTFRSAQMQSNDPKTAPRFFTPGAFASLTLLFVAAAGAAAQAPLAADTVTVGTRVVPPFVMEDGDGYDGLSVQLWDHIASELDIAFVYEERDIEGLLSGVQDGTLFASASALTVTSEREERVDFTHAFFT